MTEPSKRQLLTIALSPDEHRVVKVAARCRGESMTQLVRRLLRRELIDLER
jgi:uncharacterized protein (DUF1778 family)